MTQPADPTLGPDAELLADEWKKAWREVRRLDDEDPALDVAAQKAIKLERKIARMPAMTAEGYRAKVEVIRKAEFDDEVLLGIMFYSVATQNGSASPTIRRIFARIGDCSANVSSVTPVLVCG